MARTINQAVGTLRFESNMMHVRSKDTGYDLNGAPLEVIRFTVQALDPATNDAWYRIVGYETIERPEERDGEPLAEDTTNREGAMDALLQKLQDTQNPNLNPDAWVHFSDMSFEEV